MNERVIKVFYGVDCLPYKDAERSVHYPLIGSAFQGASNTTEFRFYTSRIGGDNRQWAVIGKLPNGTRKFTILGSSQPDSEENENYYSFMLGSAYTECKGDLYLCLGGFNGNAIETNGVDTYRLTEDSVREATGAIKLSITYSTQIEGSDEEIDTWLAFLGALGQKLDKSKGIITYDTYEALESDYANYDNGQLFFAKDTKILYELDTTLVVLFETYTQSQIDTLLSLKADKTYVDTELAKKVNLSGSNTISATNTFSGSNTFNTAPQTNDSEYGDGTGTKLTNKNYVLGIKNDLESEIADINKVIPSNADETHKLISSAEKGASNGVATLDSNQKVPLSQLPDSILGQVEYCGNFDASSSTNQTIRTPRKGDYYICNNGGYHLPTGVDTSEWQNPIDFELGDWAIYDGNAWEKIDNTDAVQSVNGETGAVVLDGTKIALSNNDPTTITTKFGDVDNNIATINGKLPKIKDYVIPTTAWSLVNGKYVAELDSGVDFVIDDNAMKIYTPTNNSDQVIRDSYGINVSSNATTQKFTFTCNIGNEAPSEVINFTIAQFGGN